VREKAEAHPGGAVDLSVGSPGDPPPPAVAYALSGSGAEHGYPASQGSEVFRTAAAGWIRRRFDVEVHPGELAACVGSKEHVALLPQWLRLRRPDRDTILYPALSYPTYEMGARLGGCRAVPVPPAADWRLDLSRVDEADVGRSLAVWVNSPGNPAGQLDDLKAAATWGRERGITVLSDECYVEFSWDDRPRSILEHGLDGVLAVHSLSKRSNLAGLRVGFYAGDPELVRYLSEVRRHAGLMVPGPVQLAAAVALSDDAHVDLQRRRYRSRMELFAEVLARVGIETALPSGGIYLWVPAGRGKSHGDAWDLLEWLAATGGCLVSPGDLYGPAGSGHVRAAMVVPRRRIELVGDRLSRA
jgi:succinyldiaminopimelate transaminase